VELKAERRAMFFDVSLVGSDIGPSEMNWRKLPILVRSVRAAFSMLVLASTAVLMPDPTCKLTAEELKGDLAVVRAEGTRKMSPDEIERRGKELRAALQQTYEEIVASAKPSGLQTDITRSVTPYVSAGMTFEEAESILKVAGFEINPHPTADKAKDPNRAKDWYAVLASISSFIQGFMRKVSVYVTLFPKSPGDYTVVDNVQASFFVSMP
jgi:hypothetical protein